MQRVFLFYHRNDMDGLASGAIAVRFFRQQGCEEINQFPFDYDDPFPYDKIPDGSDVVFMDVVKNPLSEMETIKQKYHLTVIDHHASWVNDPVAKGIPGLTSVDASGCMLTWKYYFPNKPMPRLIEMLGRYDIFDRTDMDRFLQALQPASFGAMGNNIHPFYKRPEYKGDNILDRYLDAYFTGNVAEQNTIEDTCIECGNAILNSLYVEDALLCAKSAFEATFDGHTVIALNARAHSNAFRTVYDPPRHEFMFTFYMVKDGTYSCSMYANDNTEIDLGVIAKSYGGGGHRGAAGFPAKDVKYDPEEKTITVTPKDRSSERMSRLYTRRSEIAIESINVLNGSMSAESGLIPVSASPRAPIRSTEFMSSAERQAQREFKAYAQEQFKPIPNEILSVVKPILNVVHSNMHSNMSFKDVMEIIRDFDFYTPQETLETIRSDLGTVVWWLWGMIARSMNSGVIPHYVIEIPIIGYGSTDDTLDQDIVDEDNDGWDDHTRKYDSEKFYKRVSRYIHTFVVPQCEKHVQSPFVVVDSPTEYENILKTGKHAVFFNPAGQSDILSMSIAQAVPKPIIDEWKVLSGWK